MRKLNREHENLIDLLDSVPGVEKHMQSFEVLMAEEILKRRLEIKLTQAELVNIIREKGDKITQATISKVECGDSTIGTDTYNKILQALGGVSRIEIEFGDLPKGNQGHLEYA